METDFFIVRFLITQNMPNLQVPFFRQGISCSKKTSAHAKHDSKPCPEKQV